MNHLNIMKMNTIKIKTPPAIIQSIGFNGLKNPGIISTLEYSLCFLLTFKFGNQFFKGVK